MKPPGGETPYGKIADMAQKKVGGRRKKKRRKTRFGRLHWKLTFSYSAVTLGALILLEALVIFGGLTLLNLFFRGPLLPTAIENTYGHQLINSLSPYLTEGENRQKDMQEILEGQSDGPSLSSNTQSPTRYLLVDEAGASLAAVGLERPETGEITSEDLVYLKMSEVIDEIINARNAKSVHAYVNGSLVLGIPIFTEADPESLLGVLCMATAVPTIDFALIRRLLPFILISLGVFSLAVALIGMFFGYFTSKGLVSRIQVLSEATNQWRDGNFDEVVQDEHVDELADLGEKMNKMARQLNDLIDQRRMLAVVEERNRIARDLHDSVKQKAYAAAGQISGAKEIVSKDAQKASDYLDQADGLLHEIRSELSLLINELRPYELRKKTLLDALNDYLESWSKRNQIEVKFVPGQDLNLDEGTETAVFRLIQEATSNIARHSQAGHALVRFVKSGQTLEIVVADDGVGFEIDDAFQGFGLTSIQERLKSPQRGSVEIQSQPGEGTTVRIVMHIDEVENV